MCCKNIPEKIEDVAVPIARPVFVYILIAPVLNAVLLQNDVAVANNYSLYVFSYLFKVDHQSNYIF